MDQVSVVKHHLRTEEWRKRIKECQSSGIPVTHWCNNLRMKPESDMTRFVRQVKAVADIEFLDDFIEEQMQLVEELKQEISLLSCWIKV